MNISLTSKQRSYIDEQIESGDYQNASELVRDALRLHQYYRHKMLMGLRAEIDKGWDGPFADRSVSDIIKDRTSRMEQ